jgi:hypothetical protein
VPASPSDPDAAALAGLLAEDDRLRVFAAVVLGAHRSEDVVEVTGIDPRRVVKALERLAAGGIVTSEPGGRGLWVRTDPFKDAARRAAASKPSIDPTELGATPEQAEILRNFLVDGHLTHIPAQHAKRLVVLDFLSQQFEPGKAYPERDVNMKLGMFHADYAALRRYLVDEGFLERRDAFYWRAGGTFETE